jgi:hypothetical protein
MPFKRRCFVTFFVADYWLLTKLLKHFQAAVTTKVTN